MKKLTISLSFLTLTSNAFAQDAYNIEDKFPETLIITGQYSPVENQQLTASVSIIDREKIDQSQAQTLSELLKQIPGVWVEDQGGAGGLSTISLRGSESNYTLVLLDGVEVNDPTNSRGGAFNLNAINLDSISRIEIVRGAQSAIYGSDALAGVIHIITLNNETDFLRTSLTYGENDFYSAGFQAAGGSDNLRLAAAVNTSDSGMQVDGSQSNQQELIGKISWSHDTHQLHLNYRLLDSEKGAYPEQSGGPLFAATTDLDKTEFTDQSSALQWDFSINEKWTSTTKASWYNRKETFHSPGISPYFAVPENAADTKFTRTEFQWINRVNSADNLWFNLGLANKKEDGDSNGFVNFGMLFPTDFSLSRKINSGFVNANAYLTPDLLVQGSLRQDQVESDKNYNSHQFGISYQITQQLSWFANSNNGFKLPSFFALGHPLVGNTNLKSETVDSWDTGFSWTQEKITSRISYFKHEYKNLIDFDSENFTNVNRPGVNTSGAEAEINWLASDQLNLQFHASYIDIDILKSDTHLLGRPNFTYGAAANYRFNNNWILDLNYLSVGDRFAVSQYSGDSQEEILPQYDRFDASLVWSINENHKLSLKVANLLNESYQTDIGFPAPKHYWQLRWVGNW